MIVAARNEVERIPVTIAALREALPSAVVWVADDASVPVLASAYVSAWSSESEAEAA